jgi:hypothetical protein
MTKAPFAGRLHWVAPGGEIALAGTAAYGAEETAPAETVMDAFYLVGAKWSAMARPGVDFAALKRTQLFGSDIQASRPRAAERFRATGGRTGELRQDWQGAFVVVHIRRAGLIVQGAH